jgi:hypothetical protein
MADSTRIRLRSPQPSSQPLRLRSGQALSWCDALEAEFEALYGVPALDNDAPLDQPKRLDAVYAAIHQRGPTAVCLSGGGIRSATFALGVLQGLAHVGVLAKFDYLSTVSGGGYIGGWFTTWLHRKKADGRDEVLHTLDPAEAREPSNVETPIDRVRRTCRYLALTGGVLSADVWALVATMARNLVLNWTVIIPLLMAVLLLPRLYYAVVFAIEQPIVEGACVSGPIPNRLFLVAMASFAVSWGYVVLNLIGRGGGWSQGRFLNLCLVPALVGAVSLTFFYSAYPCPLDFTRAVMWSTAVPTAAWVLLLPFARSAAQRHDGSIIRVRAGVYTIVAAAITGPILGAGAYWLGSFEYGFGAGEVARELYAVFSVPAVFGFSLLTLALFVGVASSELDDAAMEWFSRCAGWLGIAAMIWMTAGLLVFLMADLVEASVRWVSNTLALDHTKSSAVFAGLVPLLSSLAGLAARGTGSEDAKPSAVRVALAAIALPLIIWVLLSSIAWANYRLLEIIEYHSPVPHPVGVGLGEIVVMGAVLVVSALIMSAFVPTNRFSLNGMYRERLIRTFLGSSREDRHPNAFTGFDANDDICVHDLRDVRPLHIINTTLNAVSTTHVGRHERQSESFTFSPLHVGNQELGYRPADEYGSDGGRRGSGISLGMALAVSGAAVTSSLGMYSSKARAFLLTLANARLGLWFGNPQSNTTWQNSDPPLGIGPLVRELLGLTTDNNPYVYLSDGGHYENLALWEMVARRCRFIVVSDGGCDPKYAFDDLSNAVRRIRLDLGVPIDFPPLGMTREGQGKGNAHGAIGVIRYSVVDGPSAPDGTILYLKATLSGDEPIDILNFATGDPMFPHDSTADQFFDEARFESYRLLGFHTVLSVASAFGNISGSRVRPAAVQVSTS